MKFIMRQISDGWIVEFKSLGLGAYKEPYAPGIYIFESLDALFKFMKLIEKNPEGAIE